MKAWGDSADGVVALVAAATKESAENDCGRFSGVGIGDIGESDMSDKSFRRPGDIASSADEYVVDEVSGFDMAIMVSMIKGK